MLSNSQILGALLLCLCTTSSCLPLVHHRDDDPAPGYLRFPDVRRECQPVLSSAGELGHAAGCARCLKRDLYFEEGDWHQDAGGAPLLPFDGGDVPDPLHLATFKLTHADAARRGRTAVNVSGVLVLSLARERVREPGQVRVPASPPPEFEQLPGSTKLRVLFEGVYTEGANGDGGGGGEDGERVLCMVGSAVLPTRGTGASGRSSSRPPLVADGNIVLVLRYPREITLTNRALRGEMRSTNAASSAAYFDTVRLRSWVGEHSAPYRFRADELVAAACSPWPSGDADAVAGRSGELHAGVSICEVINVLAAYRSVLLLDVVPDDAAEVLGFHGDAIALQEVRCSRSTEADGCHCSERVAAVFRVLPPREHRLTAAQRSDLAGATMAAEGVWKPTTGQACMVGCLAGDENACRYRVCLYFPTTFSITRRSIMLGRITGIDGAGAGGETGGQLLFQLPVPPSEQWELSDAIRMAYNYTKINLAGEFLRRRASPFSVRDIAARSLFMAYPKKDDSAGDEVTSLFKLAEELTLQFAAVPELFRREWIERPVLRLEVLAVEQAVGPFLPASSSPRDSMASSVTGKEHAESGRRRPLLNVAAELKIIGKPSGSASALSLEGVYSQDDGRMYLVGCRDVRLRRPEMSTTSGDLEEGMDCSIEVKVEYPPTTTHCFVASAATVHVTSTRNAAAGDPLHFTAMKLKALPAFYQKQWMDGISRRIIDGFVCVAALSAAAAAALCQLRHLASHADVAPYVSHAMLAVQVVGYGVPLIAGFEAMLQKVTFVYTPPPPPPPSITPYVLLTTRELHLGVDKTVRLLALAALLLTLRVGQKVRQSRARSPGRVPDEGKVLVGSYAAHLALFVLAFALNGAHTMAVEQLVAVAQDLFLLPQVVGNAVWRVNGRPLAGGYYLGATAARVLPHVYGYVRPPPGDPITGRFFEEYPFLSKLGDAVLPVAAVVLAVVVYVQQRWNYVIIGWMRKPEQKKLYHTF
ncbi:hypothetical protein ACP4OV_018784 [Aristida adscensionis]